MKKISWSCEFGGEFYECSVTKESGTYNLVMNDKLYMIKSTLKESLLSDFGFVADGKEARLIIKGKNSDVVLNNTYMRTGKHYIKTPGWAFIFVFICAFIPIFTLGGALPFAIGISGAFLNIYISKLSVKMWLRIILCIFITAAAWGSVLLMLYLFLEAA